MKHWVFDLDGTLVDSFSHYFGTLSRIFEARGAVFRADQRMEALTELLPGFFARHLGSSAVPGALADLQDQSNEDALKVRPFAGLLQTVRTLRQADSRVAVWTNRDLVSARLILEHSGLEPLIELCVSGTCVERRKPDPQGLLRILGHFGCPAEAVTVVGDHDHDVIAAKKVGARAVRASWHSYWPMERCSHADHQFHDVEAFSDWALGLTK